MDKDAFIQMLRSGFYDQNATFERLAKFLNEPAHKSLLRKVRVRDVFGRKRRKGRAKLNRDDLLAIVNEILEHLQASRLGLKLDAIHSKLGHHNISKSAVSRYLQMLKKGGYVEFRGTTSDGRWHTVTQ